MNSFADIENNLFETEGYNNSFRFLKAKHGIDKIESQIDLIEEDITAIRNALAELEKQESKNSGRVLHALDLYEKLQVSVANDTESYGSALPEIEKQLEERRSRGETNITSALILHDEGDKEYKKDRVESYKEGKIDLVIVYSMLLTGFDAPRLKRLYLGRKIKAHNLLQTLTRVNRPYKDYQFGYVIDFADISKEFDKTNRAYLEEA